MFCCENACLYNYGLDEKTYQELMHSTKDRTVTTLVKRNRKNDFMKLLIILNDKHYIKKCWSHKSLFYQLLEQEFPGDIDIVNESDLKKNEKFIIKDTVALKKLYIRLPKENLYVDSSKYEEYLLNSITNEFLRVISTLKPMSIKLQIFNENNTDINFNMNSSISFNGLEAESGIKNQQTNNSNNKKEWLLTFTKDRKRMDLSCFLDKTKFYYLPKNTEWGDLIHNRVTYNVNTASYVYEHTINNNIDIEFLQNMRGLNIDCKYKKSNYENLRFEYEIAYYPL